MQSYNPSINLSLVSDASFPPERPLKGIATPEESLSLDIRTLPLCLFKPNTSINTYFIHVLLYPNLLSNNRHFSPPRPIVLIHTHFLFTLFIQYDQTSGYQGIKCKNTGKVTGCQPVNRMTSVNKKRTTVCFECGKGENRNQIKHVIALRLLVHVYRYPIILSSMFSSLYNFQYYCFSGL